MPPKKIPGKSVRVAGKYEGQYHYEWKEKGTDAQFKTRVIDAIKTTRTSIPRKKKQFEDLAKRLDAGFKINNKKDFNLLLEAFAKRMRGEGKNNYYQLARAFRVLNLDVRGNVKIQLYMLGVEYSELLTKFVFGLTKKPLALLGKLVKPEHKDLLNHLKKKEIANALFENPDLPEGMFSTIAKRPYFPVELKLHLARHYKVDEAEMRDLANQISGLPEGDRIKIFNVLLSRQVSPGTLKNFIINFDRSEAFIPLYIKLINHQNSIEALVRRAWNRYKALRQNERFLSAVIQNPKYKGQVIIGDIAGWNKDNPKVLNMIAKYQPAKYKTVAERYLKDSKTVASK